MSRSWSLSGDYHGTVQTIEGVAPQPYVSDVVLLLLGGQFSPRFDTAISAGYSNGFNPGIIEGRSKTYSGSVQGRFRLSRAWYAVANVNHIQNRLNAAAAITLGVTPYVDRNAVRVGFMWTVPVLHEQNHKPQPRAPRGN